MDEIEIKKNPLSFILITPIAPLWINCIGIVRSEELPLKIDIFSGCLTEDSCKLLRKKGITDYILTSKDKDLQRIILSGPRQCKT